MLSTPTHARAARDSLDATPGEAFDDETILKLPSGENVHAAYVEVLLLQNKVTDEPFTE
jgi:hypothetical protein